MKKIQWNPKNTIVLSNLVSEYPLHCSGGYLWKLKTIKLIKFETKNAISLKENKLKKGYILLYYY